MSQQCGSHIRVPDLRPRWQIQSATEHDPQGLGVAPTAAGEQRIVRPHCPSSNNHRIAACPQLMHPGSSLWTTDPLALSIGQGGSAIKTHGPLEHSPGTSGANPMHKSPVLMGGLFPQHSGDHLQAR